MSDSLPNEVITESSHDCRWSRSSIQVRFEDMVLSHLQPPFHRHPPQPRSFQPPIPIQLCVQPFRLPTHEDRSPAIRIRLLSLDPEIEERSLVAGPLDSIRDRSDFIGGSCCFRGFMGVLVHLTAYFVSSKVLIHTFSATLVFKKP
ncbi:hypothetical protein SLA2020_261430 [Shorea laevis]